jgi:pSer/pThr/pTyr-binding forkhead associated (FHA) protein
MIRGTEPVFIGRGRFCNMQVPDRAIARHQAAVVPDGDGVRLEDRSPPLRSPPTSRTDPGPATHRCAP